MLKKYEIGKVYWGYPWPFETVVVDAMDKEFVIEIIGSVIIGIGLFCLIMVVI